MGPSAVVFAAAAAVTTTTTATAATPGGAAPSAGRGRVFSLTAAVATPLAMVVYAAGVAASRLDMNEGPAGSGASGLPWRETFPLALMVDPDGAHTGVWRLALARWSRHRTGEGEEMVGARGACSEKGSPHAPSQGGGVAVDL